MQHVRDLGKAGFVAHITGDGLGLQIGPFSVLLKSDVRRIFPTLYRLYADYPAVPAADSVFSFHASLNKRRSLWRLGRRLVRFKVDGRVPHDDMPLAQALPVLEWGMNLVIALRAHAYLMLHAAVVEKHGKALLLPAAPGFGKSTLCAGLVHRGWRLLSDEFGLIKPGTFEFVPVPRPVALKNDSIDRIRSFAPDAFVSPTVKNTRKGDVAHVRPPRDSVERQAIGVPLGNIVFPRWQAGAVLRLDKCLHSEGFMLLAMNAFNYEMLGEAAFQTVTDLTRVSDCFHLVYSDLDQAIACLDEVASSHRHE